MEIEIIQQREGRWEALAMVFEGADASGFEADARLTAMWLWTLAVGKQGADDSGSGADVEDSDDEESGGKPAKLTGFVLEYDVARKKGLGW